MLIINLYKFITGYVEIAAIGEFCEKILNLFSVNRIQAWGIVRQKNELHFYLSIKDFRKIRKVRGESKVKIKIIKKCGWPFKLKKYIKRIGSLYQNKVVVENDPELYESKDEEEINSDVQFIRDCLIIIGAVQSGIRNSIEEVVREIRG